MGSALISGGKPDGKKNKFDAIGLTDITGDGHAEIQPSRISLRNDRSRRAREDRLNEGIKGMRAAESQSYELEQVY